MRAYLVRMIVALSNWLHDKAAGACPHENVVVHEDLMDDSYYCKDCRRWI